ncbi:hypothetical protein COB52_06115 [Candidatus Kaiserbacteria bacterium]|nr:MAG: hypothetical protein COB52_06115 [Candidatus Kaiserbacteria bacterium]
MKKKSSKLKNKPSPFTVNFNAVTKERGLSVRALAAILEVPESTAHDWLQGVQPTDMGPLVRLCATTGVDFQFLMTGTYSKASDPASIPLTQIFDTSEEEAFSGIFEISARRLKRRQE